MYGEGIFKMGELFDLGNKVGVVVKFGSWFSYGDEWIGQGCENVKIFLKENLKIVFEIEDKICVVYGFDFDMFEGEKGDDELFEGQFMCILFDQSLMIFCLRYWLF